MGALFFLAALPVAAVLVAIVNWWVAIGYVVLQTAGLLFGVRQQPSSVLKLDDRGIHFESGTFVLAAPWTSIERIDRVSLPSGPTDALILARSALRWSHSAQVRDQVTQRGWDKVIPLDQFEREWRRGAIGKALRANRPDLEPWPDRI